MDEAILRASFVGGALLLATIVYLYVRFRRRGAPVDIADANLSAGIYLFTSSACDECGSARGLLTDSLGESGFSEVSWEQNPVEFQRLGIAAVPATLLVGADGRATLYPGQPDQALLAVGSRS